MRTDDELRDAMRQAVDEKRVVACRVPFTKDMAIALERHMVEGAMENWRCMSAEQRRVCATNVVTAIKRAVKRVKKGRSTREERDQLAADIAIWLGHELLFRDGERYLIKVPGDVFNKPMEPA